MATKNEIEQFYKGTGKIPQVMPIGGKFSFKRLSKEEQDGIKKRLAEKDISLTKGLVGELPGLKINGKAVTKDNIHEFEKK